MNIDMITRCILTSGLLCFIVGIAYEQIEMEYEKGDTKADSSVCTTLTNEHGVVWNVVGENLMGSAE